MLSPKTNDIIETIETVGSLHNKGVYERCASFTRYHMEQLHQTLGEMPKLKSLVIDGGCVAAGKFLRYSGLDSMKLSKRATAFENHCWILKSKILLNLH